MFATKYSQSLTLIKSVLRPIIHAAIGITVSGREHIPASQSFVLISNHRTDLDPLIITSVLPRYVAWVADSFLFNIPVLKGILASIGAIPISAGKKDQLAAFKSTKAMLSGGGGVGIFPEGHDSIINSRTKLGNFYPGFAEMALRSGTPILPVTILPEEEFAHPFVIPGFVKDWLKLPEDVTAMTSRIMYRKVHVKFDPLISTTSYLPAVNADRSGKAFKSAVNHLVAKTRQNMVSNLSCHS